MSSPSYAPDESSDQLWFEQSVNISTYIGAIAFGTPSLTTAATLFSYTSGIHAAVFYRCVKVIVTNRRNNWRWLPFLFALFALGAINICASINFNQAAWIDQRNYPGGPLGFFIGQPSWPSNLVAIATSVIIVVFADAFLVNSSSI